MLYVNPLVMQPIAKSAPDEVKAAQEKLALQELDHYFAHMLMREMRKAVPREAMLGGGQQQEMFEDMLDDALAGEIAKTGTLGIAKHVEAELRAREQLNASTKAPEETPVPEA